MLYYMKISVLKINDFLKNPCLVQGVLIYGNDPGQIDFYTNSIVSIVNKNGEFSIHKMEFSSVGKSPGLLFAELANISMFSKKKFILLTNVTENISEELKKILNNFVGDNYVLIIGKTILTQATRSYFENSKNFAVISCYKDNNNNLYDIILTHLKQNNISYTNEAIAQLQRYLSNSFSFHLELEKLVIYLGHKKYIELEDIEQCLGFITYDATIDDVCSAIVDKNTNNFIKCSNTLMTYGNFSSIALLRIISKYFLRLNMVFNATKSGVNQQEAIKMLNPPLFFKQLQSFKRHIQNIDHFRIKIVLQKLLELEIICKQTDIDHKLIFQHNIVSMLLTKN